MVVNLNSIEYEKILLKVLDDKFHLIFFLSMTVSFRYIDANFVYVCDWMCMTAKIDSSDLHVLMRAGPEDLEPWDSPA